MQTIQCGRFQGTANHQYTVTFHTSFTSACYVVFAHIEDKDYNQFGSLFDNPHSMSKTGFKVSVYTSPYATQWFAIGQ